MRFHATARRPSRPRGTSLAKARGFEERAANREAREALAELLERDFAEIFSSFQRAVPKKAIAEALAAGSVGIAEEAVPWGRLQSKLGAVLPDRFAQAAEEGARIGLRFAPPAIDVDPSVVVEAMDAWIRNRATLSIDAITASSRQGVRRTLGLMMRDGVTPTDAAQRIGDLVGLTERQAQAVENFRRQLERQFIPTPEARTPQVERVIERQVEAFRQRQLRARGATIAETEGQAAIQQGERAFWEQADSQGLLDRERVNKVWKTVQDDAVCPICRPLHSPPAAAVPFDENFASLGFNGLGPPAHPRCRCYLKYEPPEPT